ncbi:MAG TPA: pyridoxal phosphate-dependent aminotransferase [Bacteroidetes bacterium]|nr:pyridoxal phosphate-dependent aminotransferase [Bacteroidota bacterium]
MLSNRILNLEESATLAMTRKSRELKAAGKDVINLSIGEPDFNTPDYIKEAAKKAINDNYTHYPPVAGYQDLREAISRKFKRDNNLDYKAEQIVVSTGAKQSIANVMMSILNPGDEVIVPTPYWVSYTALIQLAEAKAVFIQTSIEDDFKVTPEQLENSITESTKAFIFSSPCNPSGSVYTKEELASLVNVFEKYPGITIISDEIYEHINFTGAHASIAQFESVKEQVVTINGVSKGFAMTGWRVGFLGAPLEIAKACDKYQGQITSATCSIAQRATLAAVEKAPHDIPEMAGMLAAFKERRDLVLDMLSEIPGFKTNVPNGAFYIFPDITAFFGKSDGETTINNSSDLCIYILNQVHVALVPGEAFGDPNCLRISYAAANDVLIDAMQRIKKAVSLLK